MNGSCRLKGKIFPTNVFWRNFFIDIDKKTERCEKKEQILNLEIAKTQELFK